MAKRRMSGEGMVRYVKSKKLWEGRIVVGHKKNGDPIFRYVYAKTQKELLAKLHQKIDEYRDADLTEDSFMTLGEWLDKWVDERMIGTVRESTRTSYKMYIRSYIKPALGDKPVAFITTSDVQKLYNKLKANGRIHKHPEYGYALSPSTINRVHCMLHEAMDAAVREHLISKNPTNGTTIPKVERKEMQVLTAEQLETFKRFVDAEEQWRDLFYTELTTGMRRGEVCGLKWSDFDETSGKVNINRSVDLRKGVIIVGETKTGKGKRSFYLPLSTANILRERKKTAVSEWIFPDPLDPTRPVAPPAAYRKMKLLLRKAGLPDIRFHDLRHTFATHAAANGVDVKTLSGILGHTNASFTLDTYTHVTSDMQQRASAIVGDFMNDIFGEELDAYE